MKFLAYITPLAESGLQYSVPLCREVGYNTRQWVSTDSIRESIQFSIIGMPQYWHDRNVEEYIGRDARPPTDGGG